MLGVVALSAVVWAHHMFTSGMSGPLRIPFMITTELISVPTGLVFLSALGTMWEGRLRLTTPMLFAAIYYWFPKITGRMYNERQGQLQFWWMLAGFNLTFLPMFWLGMNGMNRRIADYMPYLEGTNLFVSLSAFFLGAGFLLFLYNMIHSMVCGPGAGRNPWGARTLEWQTTSPPPLENFPQEPVVVSHPYAYGSAQVEEHAEIPAPAATD